MADPIQCDNCGAVLAEADLFCGECGAPRPAGLDAGEPSQEQAPAGPKALAGRKPLPGPVTAIAQPSVPKSRSPSEVWRVVVRVLVVMALVVAGGLVLLGLLVGFVVPDPDVGRAGTEEMILGAGGLCFCPGVIFLTVAVVLWALVLRRK